MRFVFLVVKQFICLKVFFFFFFSLLKWEKLYVVYKKTNLQCIKSIEIFMQVAIEVFYNAIQTAIYSLIFYSMIGFEWKAGKFFWFYYYMLMCVLYYTLYGMMIVALTPNQQIAAICLSSFQSFWNLFSGFLIPRKVSNLLTCIFFFEWF